MKTGVSAVLITKNEEAVIKRCIDSLQGLDQIVVLDTGSTDQTREIAHGLGADVVPVGEMWKPFHFAQARNAAMQQAKHPWILTLDADEVLAEGSMGKIRDAAKNLSVHGYKGTHMNFAPGETVNGFPTGRMMLFQSKCWIWNHRIHERLVAVRPNLKVKPLNDLVVNHLPLKARQERRDQNLELLKLALREEPQYNFLLLQLGLEHIHREEWGKAVEPLQIYIKEGEFEGVLGHVAARMHLARALARSGDMQGAMNAFVDARRGAPDRREPLYWAAVELIRVGYLPDAVQWLQDAQKVPPAPLPAFCLYSADLQGTLVEDTLAECRRMMAQVEASRVS